MCTKQDAIVQKYEIWCKKAVLDPDLAIDLERMKDDRMLMEDAFYQELTFGTGGLRGIIGAGTNRMNRYTVAKASQGLANYLALRPQKERVKIAIGYDSRCKSKVFAQIASEVFVAKGFEVYLYAELMPTPCLSFAVRALKCTAGIMITASHNPAEYNGYKVYGPDGCQITEVAADEIGKQIEMLNIFKDVHSVDFKTGVATNNIHAVPKSVYDAFVNQVKGLSLCSPKDLVNKNISIIYTPLNGTGLKPVLRVLNEAGFTNVAVVSEQEKPDGRFPTCPCPNPEMPETMQLGIEYAKQKDADILIATDPDCDRVGVTVKGERKEYVTLTGNEVGILLLDYICSQRIKNGTMPACPIVIKTIVTSDITEQIAAHYNVQVVNVLTGFKFIGEQIGLLEKCGEEKRFIFGLEESCGYLSGSFVRDKNAVDSALLICEMAAYYKAHGTGLFEKLKTLYDIYGYCLDTLHSYEFGGANGFAHMNRIMELFRSMKEKMGNKEIVAQWDYTKGIDGLPKANVLKFKLEEDCSFVIRPSGTEPKLKVYISIGASSREQAIEKEKNIVQSLEKVLAL